MTAFLSSLSHLIIHKENNLVTKFVCALSEGGGISCSSSYVNRLLAVLRMDDSPYRDVMCKCVKEQLSFEVFW